MRKQRIERCRNRPTSLKGLLLWHLDNKRSLHVQDIYKMLYQAAFGPLHILSDVDGARLNLREEFRHIEASAEEPLIEEIAVGGSLIRLNLRPYKALNGDIDALFSVIIATAREAIPSPEVFKELWGRFIDLVERGELPFEADDLTVYSRQLREKGPQPLHHSQQYCQANVPAYRVLSADLYCHTL